MAMPAPKAPAGSFDAAAAGRGKTVFDGKAKCATCHVPPIFTEPGWNMHTASEIGIDDFQANRGPDKRYRTTPLAGAWAREKGGYYHDGRFPTLGDVVTHYNQALRIGLTEQEKKDLVEYLKSI
jgi:cytochrome c peroxidase